MNQVVGIQYTVYVEKNNLQDNISIKKAKISAATAIATIRRDEMNFDLSIIEASRQQELTFPKKSSILCAVWRGQAYVRPKAQRCTNTKTI